MSQPLRHRALIDAQTDTATPLPAPTATPSTRSTGSTPSTPLTPSAPMAEAPPDLFGPLPVEPGTVLGLAKLATMQFRGQDIMPVYRQLAERLQQDPDNVAPLMDVAIIDQFLGWPQRGLTIQTAALRAQRVFRLANGPRTPALRLLGFAMAGPINANTPIEFLIEDSEVDLTFVYVVPGMPLPEIPDHDLAIVLAAESEPARPVFAELEALLADWPRPVLNRPELIPLLGRESLFRLCEGIEGIEIPATVRVDAQTIARVGHGAVPIEALLPDGGFPVIARPVDSHGGHGLEKLDTAEQVEDYLARNAVPEYYLSRFVDYRSPDGYFRKYRIAVIDGVPFASHLAISDHWMIHFLNAGMTESEEKQREEERFMDAFQEDFAARHADALGELAELSGLEYFGVDCGVTQGGKLLLFEADTSLIVHNMDSPVDFPYKDRHMRPLFHAFQAMLARKAGKALG